MEKTPIEDLELVIVGRALEGVELLHRDGQGIIIVGDEVTYDILQPGDDHHHLVGEHSEAVEDLLFLLLAHGVDRPFQGGLATQCALDLLERVAHRRSPRRTYMTRFRA